MPRTITTATSENAIYSSFSRTNPPFPVGDPRNRYIIFDRKDFDVEALAQRQIRYLKASAEANEYLSKDPARRDRACAELNQNPKVQKEFSPYALVPLGGDLDPNDYLAWIDRELDKEPTTFEDHVLRTHLSFNGVMIFEEYIMLWGLYLYPDERKAVHSRVAQVMNAFVKELMGVSGGGGHGPSTEGISINTLATPPPSSPHDFDSAAITPKQIDKWMSNVTESDLSQYTFTYKATEEPGDSRSTWRMVGVSMKKKRATYQVEMMFEEGSCIIPMDGPCLRDLLMDSDIQGEVDDKSDDEGDGIMGFL